jgi:hypothetical protein
MKRNVGCIWLYVDFEASIFTFPFEKMFRTYLNNNNNNNNTAKSKSGGIILFFIFQNLVLFIIERMNITAEYFNYIYIYISHFDKFSVKNKWCFPSFPHNNC